jgi:hypothetical protein
MRRLVSLAVVSALGMSVLIGCSQPRPMGMAPPVNQNAGNPGYAGAQPSMGGNMAPPVASNNAQGGGVYQWQDVPANQQVPITRATFDQGGYQIFAQSGETIVVPFANSNLYVMKFGRSNSGQPYFVNENGTPVLYLSPGMGLENAAAQGALWYPIPQTYTGYTQPMYVALAPSWNDYANMGWYPGMSYYGGMFGYTPYSHFAWMPGWYINVGGHRYNDYHNYYSYYNSTPGYIRNRVVYTNYNAPRGVVGRSFGSTGSYNAGRSTGSFGSGRMSGSTGTFGSRPSNSTGSFGSGRQGGTFGSGNQNGTFGSRPSTGSGGFGNRTPAPSGGSFGSRPSGGSFGGGASGYTAPSRPSGSSFGGGGSSSSGRSSGSSFGGGSSGRSSGSFGGGRRR